MSRTTRRGKPSRNFHKYISLGVIDHENRRWYAYWAMPEHQGHLYWKDGAFDTTTYEEYTEKKIRNYHMDYLATRKAPGHVNRMDIEYHRRQCKRAIFETLRSGEFDVMLPVMEKRGQRIWDWW